MVWTLKQRDIGVKSPASQMIKVMEKMDYRNELASPMRKLFLVEYDYLVYMIINGAGSDGKQDYGDNNIMYDEVNFWQLAGVF